MPRREIDPLRYLAPALPDLPTRGPSAAIKTAWVDRAARWIQRQPKGIETWRPDDGKQIVVTELVDAYIKTYRILDEWGHDVGFMAQFYMRERNARQHEHMGTIFFGPPRSALGLVILKRAIVKVQYHI